MTDPTPSPEPAETGLASQTVDEEIARLKTVASKNGATPEPSPFDINRVTLSNGIVLRIKGVNGRVQRAIVESIPLPEIPVVKGAHDLDEDNPSDPDYLDALAAAQDERLRKIDEAFYTLGTSPEVIPEGCYGPDEDRWIEELAIVGAAVGPFADPLARYRAWMLNYALSTNADATAVSMSVIGKTGILDAEVQKALAGFQRRTQRDADPGASPAAGDGDGDHVRPDDPGDGGRTRRAERRAR